ncbi:MAG: helix-turn-helix transcriptional regulator [Clostridiales bacterium]|nr:helix-turn-helix transcriptional regulator [Clostridiales bacterium]
MKVSYKKLWVMLAEREMSKAELRKQAGLSSATFTKLRKNQEVTLSVILKIADVLDCNAGDMMDFIKDEATQESSFTDTEA